MSGLELRLLGAPRVENNGAPVAISRRKALALLAYLAVLDTPQSRETLAALLWPEADAKRASASLRNTLWSLKQVLGEGWSVAAGENIGLRPGSDRWLDVAEFRRLLASWTSHDHGPDEVCSECEVFLTDAVALYRGDFLAGFTLPDSPEFDDWHYFETESLRRDFAGMLERLVALHTRQGELEPAIAHARRWLSLDVLNEAAHRRLMRLYAHIGQRNAALRQYRECLRILEEELGVLPQEETTQLFETIRLGQELPPVAISLLQPAPSAPRHNLPRQTTPFIGREEELAKLEPLLSDAAVRMITVHGPGGVGKSRLALEAAERSLSRFEHGATFVRMAPLSDAVNITPAIASAAGHQLHGSEDLKTQVLNYLQNRSMLLILDNFEHILEGVALVTEILQTAPEVTVLATSREKLNLSSETVFTIDGLDYPDWEMPEDALAISAVQLFMQSARRTQSEFEPQGDDLQHISRICHLVSGMPLGILLAAGWTDVLSPQEIARKIAESIDFLETEMRDIPERQRSMQAVLDHSWRLLDEREQDAFARMSVFWGGFGREAARQVAGATLRMLTALINKSFLRRDPQSGRFEIHELLRQYAQAHLEAADQADAARDAHVNYYADFMGEREPDLKGIRQLAALDEIEADFENVRAAWRRAVLERNYAGLDRMVESLKLFVEMRSRLPERDQLLGQAQERLAPEPGHEPHPTWCRIVVRRKGFLESREDAGPLLERCLAIARQHDDRAEAAHAMFALGDNALGARDPSKALTCFEDSLAHYQELNDSYHIAQTLNRAAYCSNLLGQYANYFEFAQQSLDLARDIGDRIGTVWALHSIAFANWMIGNYNEAIHHYQEAEAIWREIGHLGGQAQCKNALSTIALLQGNFSEAHTLAEGAMSIATDLNIPRSQANAAGNLGVLFMAEGDYARGETILNEHRTLLESFPVLQGFLVWGDSIAACGREDYRSAKKLNQGWLKSSYHAAMQMWLVPISAILLAHEGEMERAVGIMGLLSAHPLSPRGWFEKWALYTRSRADLETELGCEAYAAAWERGKALEVEAAVQELLAEWEEDCQS
ncbi:MAG: ATP-binding protein [Planctomycetota bacterium]|jgi:predicted ATPase/DNA-binding SARP family transcriptional activator